MLPSVLSGVFPQAGSVQERGEQDMNYYVVMPGPRAIQAYPGTVLLLLGRDRK